MFIFQLPATIFFLIVVFFIKISVRIDCYCRFLNFKYLVHAHIRSASVSKKSGSRKISIIFMTLLAVELSGCRPISNWAKGLDRKSTRLNSSHANISYAVFCLKKKKTIQILYLDFNAL